MEIPRLHPDTIEEIKQRVDIYDIVSEQVSLKKSGKDYTGLCPFHDEKTPSFTVSPSKQMYYCFGCGAGGGAINFLMETGKRPFNEVVFDLAKRYQIPIRTLEPEKRQELQRQITLREQLYEILAITTNFYQHALYQPGGNVALEYLQIERKLTPETIQQFQLGYAPAGWETLYHYLLETKKFPVQLIEAAGLIVNRKSGTGYYDRFRDRLMIPICDLQGRVIGFGGRTLTDEMPKYLNSPETELFEKGKTLFALDKAKTAISKQDKAIIVEGYFDAIALHSAGITNAVASLGTALSLNQIRQLLRYTESKQIILNFDADKAGTNAAERAIGEIASLAYRGDVNLRILRLPDGKDADEYLKSYSAESYQELLQNASLWLNWQIENILQKKDINQPDQYQQIATEMVALLCNITNDNQLTYYVDYCAELLSLKDSRRTPMIRENLLNQISSRSLELLRVDESYTIAPLIESRQKISSLPLVKTRSSHQKKVPEMPVSGENNLLKEAEAFLLQSYIHYPEYRSAVLEVLVERNLEFTLDHHKNLWQFILNLNAFEAEPLKLISDLQDCYLAENSSEISKISYLFHLDEKTQLDIVRTPLVIRAAAASIDRVICENKIREALQELNKIDFIANLELAQFHQQQLLIHKNRIKELEKERYTTFKDLVSVPWL
jgi:DNA primase